MVSTQAVTILEIRFSHNSKQLQSQSISVCDSQPDFPLQRNKNSRSNPLQERGLDHRFFRPILQHSANPLTPGPGLIFPNCSPFMSFVAFFVATVFSQPLKLERSLCSSAFLTIVLDSSSRGQKRGAALQVPQPKELQQESQKQRCYSNLFKKELNAMALRKQEF